MDSDAVVEEIYLESNLSEAESPATDSFVLSNPFDRKPDTDSAWSDSALATAKSMWAQPNRDPKTAVDAEWQLPAIRSFLQAKLLDPSSDSEAKSIAEAPFHQPTVVHWKPDSAKPSFLQSDLDSEPIADFDPSSCLRSGFQAPKVSDIDPTPFLRRSLFNPKAADVEAPTTESSSSDRIVRSNPFNPRTNAVPKLAKSTFSNSEDPKADDSRAATMSVVRPGSERPEIEIKPKLVIAEGKPNVSYVYMIQEAIKESPDRKLTLAFIYRHIEQKYPYFAQLTGKRRQSWQNSVRHNLSLNDCFIKIPKDGNKTGTDRKGHLWMLDKSCEDQFEEGNCKRRRRMKRPSKQPYIDDAWLMWGQHQLVNWQNFVSTNSDQPPVDFFNATPPALGQSSMPSALAPFVPTPAHNTFCSQSISSSSDACENPNPNGCFLPAAATLVNGRSANRPMNFCYYPPPPPYRAAAAPF